MTSEAKARFSTIVKDNEDAFSRAIAEGHFVQGFILIHSLIESLLRAFLRVPDDKECSFHQLIAHYATFLENESYPETTFVDELTQFNRRRNRIIHSLWKKGHSRTNAQTQKATMAAVMLYALFIEWLETFDTSIAEFGFSVDEISEGSAT